MLREAQRDAETKRLWQRRIPWLLAGAVVAGVVLTLLGLHVVGRWETVCGLLGGRHGYFTDDGVEASGFRQW